MSVCRSRRRIPNRVRQIASALTRLAAMVGLSAACAAPHRPPLESDGRRLELLDAAFAARTADPNHAAELLAEAGPGPVLERVRLEAWIGALERVDGDEAAWRRLLDTRLPADLEVRARLGLARLLAAAERTSEAVAVLEGVPDAERLAADAELLVLEDGPWRSRAAERLAVTAPALLRRQAPELERAAVAALGSEERLARAEAWRHAGHADRAASELRRERWRGEPERLRRIELARAEVEAGSPTRALAAVRGMPSTDSEAEAIRGQACRRQGWQRWPRSAARDSFTACLHHARRAVLADQVATPVRAIALQLVVECGTEIGRLEEAFEAWQAVEAIGWSGDRRGWLGRRLGVALAVTGGYRDEVEKIAASLPEHGRCLRYWAAIGSLESPSRRADLTGPVFLDLYGLWQRETSGSPPPRPTALGPTIEPAPVPWQVAWLLEREATAEAAGEWRRIRKARGTTGPEGLAEAGLADRRGRRNEAISVLREAFPDLGTVAMERAPGNAVLAYLPLPWSGEVRAAAAEFGLEPWLVAAVARQESGFVPHARSPRGAIGVMQLLPGTARGHALALGLGARPDLEQPELNLRLGSRELGRLLGAFGEVEPALAAYNAGESRVRRWWREAPDRFRFTESIPIPETYSYVRRVRFLAEAYRVAYDHEWRMSP